MHANLREMIEERIPEHMRPGLIAYIEEGQPPGGFLRAVLENDLCMAMHKADVRNSAMMSSWAFILTRLPPSAWGSKEKVDAWIEARGLKGAA